MSRFAGSPSSANLCEISYTPIAKSERSSKKSSTAKSPSSCAMPHAAGTVSRNAMVAINADLRNVPEFNAILCNHSSGTKWVTPFFSSMLLPRFTSHSSTDSRIIGTHKPVSKNAEKIPNAASTPNDRSTAISLKRFAANAAIVVTEVRQIARPTRCSVISAAVCEDLPFIRSSL